MMRSFILFFLPLLAACSSPVHKIDIRQGNMVTQAMVAQLKQGQTKDQVRFILGTPLVADVFHADRWDYLYRFQPGRAQTDIEQRHIVVFFENGKLSRVAGDVQASLPASTAELPSKPVSRVIEIAPAGESSN
jgi:outer membrane protein assembly factor BamE